jgi:hypothetical protein
MAAMEQSLVSGWDNSVARMAAVRWVDTTGALWWHIEFIILRLRWLFAHGRFVHDLRYRILPAHSYGLHLLSA